MPIQKQFSLLFAWLSPLLLFPAEIKKETRIFAVKDKQELKMDIYAADTSYTTPQPCLIFVFGGGFKEGKRDAAHYQDFFDYFAYKGFKVVSIDYRLGMVNQKAPGIFNQKPIKNAVGMAVSDLLSATNYLLLHAQELNIDPAKIIASGSSAGAITVLQADYEINDKRIKTSLLPQEFRYAGIIALAGAIFSNEGLPTYTTRPAPTLFFHGSSDKLVVYNKVQFFNQGLFGSKSLVKRFKSEGYPYIFYSMEKIGHDVSEYPMQEFLPEIYQFIVDLVFESKQWMIDINFNDKLRKPDRSMTPNNFYD